MTLILTYFVFQADRDDHNSSWSGFEISELDPDFPHSPPTQVTMETAPADQTRKRGRSPSPPALTNSTPAGEERSMANPGTQAESQGTTTIVSSLMENMIAKMQRMIDEAIGSHQGRVSQIKHHIP